MTDCFELFICWKLLIILYNFGVALRNASPTPSTSSASITAFHFLMLPFISVSRSRGDGESGPTSLFSS